MAQGQNRCVIPALPTTRGHLIVRQRPEEFSLGSVTTKKVDSLQLIYVKQGMVGWPTQEAWRPAAPAANATNADVRMPLWHHALCCGIIPACCRSFALNRRWPAAVWHAWYLDDGAQDNTVSGRGYRLGKRGAANVCMEAALIKGDSHQRVAGTANNRAADAG